MNWKGIYSGWIKNYSDGSSYIATDTEIRRRNASWRNSKNNGVISVGIKYGTTISEIYGVGDYWQSDMFSVNFPYSDSKLIRRNIQKKIKEGDRFISIVRKTYSIGLEYLGATISSSIPGNLSPNVVIITLTDEDIGKWFTLSIDIEEKKNQKIKYHLFKEMI